MKPGDSWFVDQYTQEYSRSIDPMIGGHYDAYYYQMVDYIRQYKGVRPSPEVQGNMTITIDGDFKDWQDVKPEYRDSKGDVFHRDHPGWGRIKSYTNFTGRNDFVLLKVARDDEKIYFYAETDKPLTRATDKNWMLLFIDSDGDYQTGWEGYDYLVNHEVIDGERSIIKRYDAKQKCWSKSK